MKALTSHQLVKKETLEKMMKDKAKYDVGCGGGIYTKTLSDMGVDFVTGADFSEAMLEGARENCKDYQTIPFQNGSAFETGVESSHYDLLLERALKK